MTDEELAKSIQEISEQIDQLPDDPEKAPTKEERTQKLILQLRLDTLKRIQAAREKGHWYQEIRAGIDYALLSKYGEKHPLLMNFIKSQIGWYGF